MILIQRKLLRYSLLIQLYNDLFTYGYENCVIVTFKVPDECRIEIMNALYYLYYKKWIFFNIEKDGTVSAYISGSGIDEIENNCYESGQLLMSKMQKDILIRDYENK